MILLTDIDHTLSDAFWRDELIGQWDEYHEAAAKDKLIEPTAKLLAVVREAGWSVVGLTTRPEKWRSLTMKWLLHHNVQMDELIMRPNDDYRPSAESKLAIAKERFPDLSAGGYLLLEDRDDVIAAFKGAGVIVYQVHAGKSQTGKFAGPKS